MRNRFLKPELSISMEGIFDDLKKSFTGERSGTGEDRASESLKDLKKAIADKYSNAAWYDKLKPVEGTVEVHGDKRYLSTDWKKGFDSLVSDCDKFYADWEKAFSDCAKDLGPIVEHIKANRNAPWAQYEKEHKKFGTIPGEEKYRPKKVREQNYNKKTKVTLPALTKSECLTVANALTKCIAIISKNPMPASFKKLTVGGENGPFSRSAQTIWFEYCNAIDETIAGLITDSYNSDDESVHSLILLSESLVEWIEKSFK